MPTNAREVAKELRFAVGTLLPEQMVLVQRKLCLDFLNGANLLAAVDTGRMRFNIRAWAENPVYTNEDPPAGLAKGGTVPPEIQSLALAALADLKPYGNAGVSCGVEYSSYVEDGTEKMQAQPFFSPNVERIKRQITSFDMNGPRAQSTELLGA